MTKLPYIVTAITIVLAGLFAILNRFWTGFVYFMLVTLLLLSLFWFGWLLYKYFTDFKQELDERFKFERARILGSGQVTAVAFDENLPYYKKQFKKKVFKDKFIKWFQIALCLAFAVMFITAMVFI